MAKQYHILNGDALKDRFPESIPGERIVTRECLIDGDVCGETLDQLFSIRAAFLNKNYGDPERFYYDHVVTEFQKIQLIESDSEVNLWFEDDLFCQVNFWFVAHLLHQSGHQSNRVFLVRPKPHTKYSFAGLSNDELLEIHHNRIPLKDLAQIAELWIHYQKNDLNSLSESASRLSEKFPFIQAAVKAHIDRIPTKDNPGRIVRSVIQIMEDLGTQNFGKVFQEFCKREAIYGLGDLQVKRLFEKVLEEK